jgi:glycosyltransferase involved in cell wall biosynthesis
MRIAIDARPLTSELTGIGRYTYNILKQLIKIAPEHEWYLYAHRPLKYSLPDSGNIHIRTGQVKRNLASTFFAQLIFPVWSRLDKVDIFWSPRHHLPILLPQKTRKIVTIHDIVWKRHPETMTFSGRFIEKMLMPYALKHSDKIISVSSFTKNELVDAFGIAPERITVTRLAPTKYTGKPVPLPKELTSTPYLLFVGTLEPRKNLVNILIAFKNFNQNNNYLLVIVGGKGWGNISIMERIRELNLEESVIVYGYTKDNLLHTLYNNCTALLMPSLYEGFGLPAIEALQYGKIVISTKKSALPELNSPLVILTDDESSDSIIHAMTKIDKKNNTTTNENFNQTWNDAATTTKDILFT